LIPSSPVHPFTTALLFTTAQVFTGYLVDLDGQLLWLREGFFCFVKRGFIQSAVIQPAIIRTAIVRTIIQPAVALHLVVCFDVEKCVPGTIFN